MAVTEATARKAVERWSLSGYRVQVVPCGCRYWTPLAAGVGRRVAQCRAHRPAWLRQVISNADR